MTKIFVIINYISNIIDIVKIYIVKFIIIMFYETQHPMFFYMFFKKF